MNELVESTVSEEVIQPSEDVLVAPSPDEEVAPQVEEEESEGGEGEVEETRDPESYSLEELRGMARTEGLTPALYDRMSRLEQSERDRQAHEQTRLAEIRGQQAARAQQIAGARQRYTQIVGGAIKRISDGEDLNTNAVLVDRALDELMQQSDAIAQLPVHQAFDNLFIQVYGDSAALRQQLENMDLATKAQALYQSGIDAEKRRVAGAQQAVRDAEKVKKNPPRKPSAQKVAGTPNGGMTIAQIEAMNTSEWLSMGTPEERQKLLADAKQRERAKAGAR